ncbi:cytochrome C peroxidase [Lewinellaceae bacterium SD302]|nr:cytochrome C peroxidase [Lewinellaceae bacterium SD302]
MKNLITLFALSTLFFAFGCEDDDSGMMGGTDDDGGSMITSIEISGPSNPTSYNLEVPSYLPGPIIPEDNPLTVEGVQLGRKLFYDPILSRDSTISCSSCHQQQLAFTDGQALSIGIEGQSASRNAMSPVNMVFNPNNFHWDGAHESLEIQAIHPVENMLEMDADWEEVEERLRNHPGYPQDFRAAFGIGNTNELTRELATRALGQFERTMISGQSRYDKVVSQNDGFFTELEEEGKQLFFVEFNPSDSISHPGCSHCHNAPRFGDNLFHNNGLDSVASLTDFADLGLGGVNGNVFDNGKFRTPTLRNIALTAPYMHDGRFSTLEEVLEQYARGGHGIEGESPFLTPFELTPEKQAALLAFLNTLTDEEFINDERFSNPFE